MRRIFGSILLVSGMLGLSIGCASSSPSQAAPSSQPSAVQTPSPIPPDSPLAKIKVGMGTKEVFDLLGQPTDTDTHMTGKGFNPFYYGGDTHRMTALYKGLGRVTFTRQHAFTADMRVMEGGIIYDPSERGYK
jgi:outer membrane protein assembly factor BamE (lipoprotein component of BamABCDE complex)